MSDKEFLLWLRDRLVFVYKESPNTDFVLKLTKIAESKETHKDCGGELIPAEYQCIKCGQFIGNP